MGGPTCGSRGYDSPRKVFSIGLGCDVCHAPRLVYAKGLVSDADADAVTPIGIGCKVCEREDCPHIGTHLHNHLELVKRLTAVGTFRAEVETIPCVRHCESALPADEIESGVPIAAKNLPEELDITY